MAVIRNTQIPDTKGELLFGFIDLLELLLHHWLEDIRVALEKGCPDVAPEVTDYSPGHHPCSPRFRQEWCVLWREDGGDAMG